MPRIRSRGPIRRHSFITSRVNDKMTSSSQVLASRSSTISVRRRPTSSNQPRRLRASRSRRPTHSCQERLMCISSATQSTYDAIIMSARVHIAVEHYRSVVFARWRPFQPFFTARGYAKRGICRRRVSVCVSVCLCVCVCVCHTPVLYQNG